MADAVACYACIAAPGASLAVRECDHRSLARSDALLPLEPSFERGPTPGGSVRRQPVRARVAAVRVCPGVRGGSRRMESRTASRRSPARLTCFLDRHAW